MKCPHCGKGIPHPSPKQQLAYKLVYGNNMTHRKASEMMGTTRQAVGKLLRNLRKIRPELFPEATRKKILSYDDTRDYKLKGKF